MANKLVIMVCIFLKARSLRKGHFSGSTHSAVCFVLDQHVKLDFYGASSLKQRPMGRPVAALKRIIRLLKQIGLLLDMYHKACFTVILFNLLP
jgi:hypothetical protein